MITRFAIKSIACYPYVFRYVAKDYYESCPAVKQVLDQIKSGYFTPDEPNLFNDIYNSLVYHDR